MSKTKVVLLAAGGITKLIETVEKIGGQYQEVLHTAAVQCLAHAAAHGDRSLLARLIGGNIKSKDGTITEKYPGVISKATSARELRVWVSFHSPLRWDNDGAIVESKSAKDKGVTYDIEAANAEPFWDLSINQEDRQRPIGIDNLQNVVFGTRKRFERALASGAFQGDAVAMRKWLDAIEAVPFPKVSAKNEVKADFKPRDAVELVKVQGLKVKDQKASDDKPQEVPEGQTQVAA